MVVAEIQGIAQPRLSDQFSVPRDAVVCWLAERQGRHRRAAPVENLVRGKHAAVRRSRGAVEPLRSPQDGLHPQTSAVRVPNSLQLLQVHVREEPIHLNASRVARLDGSRQSAPNRAVLLRRIRCRQLAADLETVTVLHERRVGVLSAVIRPECPWNSHVGNEPMHHSEDGRCALVPCPVWALKAGSAVHKHDDVPRASQGFRERSHGVDVDQVEWSLFPGCGAVRCRRADALGHRTPRAWCQLPHQLDTMLLGSGFQHTRMGVGKGNMEVVNIYYSFFIFVDVQSTRR